MQKFERDYAMLAMRVMQQGEQRQTRAGAARSLFGETLQIRLDSSELMPLIQGRQMFPEGIIGEFATFMSMAKNELSGFVHLKEFESRGCNYWKQWADGLGWLQLDYGSQWNAGGQLAHVVDAINNNPTDRRMLIDSWVPDHVHNNTLSLPCCHYAYQFYVRDNKYVDILWHQRSTDVMVGLPSDIMLAWMWLVHLCSTTESYVPGTITMTLGDTHVYEAHVEAATEYCSRVLYGKELLNLANPIYLYQHTPDDVYDFNPDGLSYAYDHLSRMNFEVLG